MALGAERYSASRAAVLPRESLESAITKASVSLDAMPLLRDLHLPVDYSARLIAESVLRRLFTEDEKNAAGCAVESECLDDGRRWRISINDGLRWSDGRRLKAEDVLHGLEHAINGRSNGASLFLSSETDGGESPLQVLSPTTVEYRFDRPIAFAPALLSLPAFAPRRADGDRNGQELSLGSHVVAQWTADVITLRHHDFTSAEDASPGELRYLHVPTAADAVARYEAGELDATSPTGFGVDQVRALDGRPDAVSTPIDIFGTLDFGRHAPRTWLASAGARRALSGLLQRSALESCTHGLALPWHWPGPDALGPGAAETAPEDQDLELLRRGIESPLDIAYAAFDPNAEIAVEVAAQIGLALGMQVTTSRLSFEEYVRASASREYCMLYSLTVPAFCHPAGYLSDWRSTGRAARRSGIADPVLDARLDVAESCLDSGTAEGHWEQVVTRWCELMPKIPLVRVRAWFLRGERVANLYVPPSGLVLFGRTASEARTDRISGPSTAF